MTLRMTTLSENTAGLPGVLAEWGLSVLVEFDGAKILMDTGASISVPHNALAFGIDLTSIEKIVISHGHYDHTGGLEPVLRQVKREIEVIAHPDMWADKYTHIGDFKRYIGPPTPRGEMEALGARFRLSREPVWLNENIVTTGEIPMVTDYEQIESNLRVKEGDALLPDPLLDDRALIIKTEVGLIVILGCAHRGTINTIKHAQAITGIETIHTVIGGTHLLHASEERILLTAAALQEMGIQRVGVSHCTGFRASALLAQQLGDAFFVNNAGTVVTMP